MGHKESNQTKTKLFQKNLSGTHNQSVKRYGSRLGPTECYLILQKSNGLFQRKGSKGFQHIPGVSNFFQGGPIAYNYLLETRTACPPLWIRAWLMKFWFIIMAISKDFLSVSQYHNCRHLETSCYEKILSGIPFHSVCQICLFDLIFTSHQQSFS